MSDRDFLVRRLIPADAALYRTIRLDALATAPEAFGSTHATEAARPMEAAARRLEQTTVFAAMRGDAVLGMAGFYRADGPKEQHKGGLWGVFVRPECRGIGVGAAVVQAVIDHAAGEVETLLLTVVSSNPGARKLYDALGFVEYGLEPRSLKVGDIYFDEVLMFRRLGPA